MENEIKKTIDGLAKAFEEETTEENKSKVDELLAREDIDWKNPDVVNVLYFFKENGFLMSLIKRVYPELNEEQYSRIHFIYKNYDLLSHQIKTLADMGRGGCADVSRWIIEQYLIKCTGEVPENYPEGSDKFWHPSFGTIYEWMELCENVYWFFYRGFTEDYNRIFRALSNKKRVVALKKENEDKKVSKWSECIPEKIQDMKEKGLVEKSLEFSWIMRCMLCSEVYKEVVNDELTDERFESVVLEIIQNRE